MSDPFALLGLERRPLVDSGLLRSRYLQLSKVHHPDATCGNPEDFDSLRQAFETLRNPATRLRVLATGIDGKWSPPEALFEATALAMDAARGTIQSKPATSSPLVSALHTQKVTRARNLLTIARTLVTEAQSRSCNRLASLDAEWPAVDAAELSALASEFTFLSRWSNHLDEAAFDLNQVDA